MKPFLLSCLFSAALCCAAQTAGKPTTQDPPAGKAQKPAATKPQEAGQPAGSSQGGVVVFIDPATGRIRQPAPSEIGTLAGQSRTAATAAQPMTVQGPGGAVGVKLGEDLQVYAVATQTADGKTATECVTGKEPALARARSEESAKKTQ